MLQNNNNAAVARLAKRSFKANRKRNLIATAAIALTTVLFTTLFTLGLGMVDALQQSTMRQSGGSAHAAIKYVTPEVYAGVKNHPQLKEIGYSRLLADGVENEQLLKRGGEFWYMDDTARTLRFAQPTTGRAPQAENEIIADTEALGLLGVPLEVGAPVELMLYVGGETTTRSFVLTGWWESDAAFNVSVFVASDAYLQAHAGELVYTGPENGYAGMVHLDLMFNNSMNLQEKLDAVITDSGYSKTEGEANYIASNVSWAYLGSSAPDPTSILAVVLAALLIAATGYLIIYNIFQISVMRDIRFYGLLKTIGGSARQIRRLVRRGALRLCVLGIPLGLVLGYLVGIALVPLVLENTFMTGGATITANPLIFIGAAVFSLATVLVSTGKPCRMAGSVSPIEALRYTDGGTKPRRRAKKGTRGGKIGRMALANLGRNKKRTVLVVLSLSLSIVLLNMVFTLSSGFSLEKYLARDVNTDYMVGHAALRSFAYNGAPNAVGEDMIALINEQPGFEAGGRLYKDDTWFSEGSRENMAVYGMDPWLLEQQTVLEGEIDYALFATGGYVIEGVMLDDNGQPYWDDTYYSIGETITLAQHSTLVHETVYDFDTGPVENPKSGEFTVMAKIAVQPNLITDGYSGEALYTSPEGLARITNEQPVMAYSFNIQSDAEDSFTLFMQELTDSLFPQYVFNSRETQMAEFETLRLTILAIGGILSFIIGIIGILNFLNSILTSILARRQEFAVLESIGMTRRQLRRMLCLEGLLYAALTILVSLVLGILLSLLSGAALESVFWFFEYHLIITPMALCWPLLLLLGVAIPLACFKGNMKESTIQRLRDAA